MQAKTPAELALVFQHHLNRGDVDGLMSNYYADAATYAPVPGVVVRDAEVRSAIGRLAALGAPIEVDVRHTYVQDDVALVVIDWEIPAAGMSGTATDVGRRQPDGTWRCIIDNPHGAAVTAQVSDEAAKVLMG